MPRMPQNKPSTTTTGRRRRGEDPRDHQDRKRREVGRKRIDSILARLGRGGRGGGRRRGQRRSADDPPSASTPISSPPPPDEVSSALGRSLASAYASAYFPQLASASPPSSSLDADAGASTATGGHGDGGADAEAGEVGAGIADALSSRSCTSGSVSHSFFESLASASAAASAASSSYDDPPSPSAAEEKKRRCLQRSRSLRDCLGRLLDVWSGWPVQLEDRIDVASTLRGGGGRDDGGDDDGDTPDAVAASVALGACVGGFVRAALCLSKLEVEVEIEIGGINSGDENRSHLASAYDRMRSSPFRRLLLADAASAAVGVGGGDGCGGVGQAAAASHLLSPLLVRCLLHPTVATAEKRHCLSCVIRGCRRRLRLTMARVVVAAGDDSAAATAADVAAARGVFGGVVRCLTRLSVLYVRMNALARGRVRGEAEELVLEWCTDLTELVHGTDTDTVTAPDTAPEAFDGMFFVEEVASEAVPFLVASPVAVGGARRSLRPLLLLLRDVVDRSSSPAAASARHQMAVFRLCLSALNSPVKDDVCAMLSLLHSLVADGVNDVDIDGIDGVSFDRASCEAVATVLSASGPRCAAGARRLLLLVEKSRSAGGGEKGALPLNHLLTQAAEARSLIVPLLFRPSSCQRDPCNAATLAEMLDSILCVGEGGGDGDDDEDRGFLPTFTAPATQAALVHLVSSCLLCRDGDADDRSVIVRDAALRLTERVAAGLPHLSIRLYPVLLRLLRNTTHNSGDDSDDEDDDDAELLALRILKLLAGPMSATNPHVATQTLNLLSGWIADVHAPTPLRSTSIRMLPLLCETNRRMFRRVSDLLKSEMLLKSKIQEIGVATAASITDLCLHQPDGAAEELLGVLQGALLIDDDQLVVSFGIKSLHHLVDAGRLDFDVTIKVLKKRMKFDVADVGEVLGQDVEVVKALVILFGDGAGDGDGESGDEGGDAVVTPPRPSPQVASAVRVLWGILSEATAGVGTGVQRVPASVRAGAYRGLAGYDVGTLGIDGEAIRDSVGSVGGGGDGDGGKSAGDDDAYRGAVRLVLNCLRLETAPSSPPSSPSPQDAHDDDDGEEEDRPLPQLERLIRNVAGAEYDALGSSLWTRPESRNAAAAAVSSSSASAPSASVPSKSALSALPDETRIRSIYEEEPSTASAASLLFALQVPSPPWNDDDEAAAATTIAAIDDAMATISDLLCDLRNDDGPASDPLIKLITLSAWVHAMRKVWWAALSVGGDHFDSAADHIVGRLDDLADDADDHGGGGGGGGGADNVYVAMAASALVLSERRAAAGAEGNEGSAKVPTLIASLCDRVSDAANRRLFDSGDDEAANLCTSLVALSSIHTQDAGRLDAALEVLLGSLDDEDDGGGIGGSGSFFGAVVGLGLVAEGLGASMGGGEPDRTTTTARIRRVVARLVEELTRCLSVRHDPVVRGLGPMILTGKPTADLVARLKSLDGVSIRPDATRRFRTCCLGVGFALPALARFHVDFVAALYRLLMAVPWGSGKGHALPSAFRICTDAGLLTREERDSYARRCSSAAASSDPNGAGDAMIALVGTTGLPGEGGESPSRGEILTRLRGYASPGGGDNPSSAGVASIALCSAIGIVPAIAPALEQQGGATFASPPCLRPESTKADVKSTLAVLDGLLVNGNDGLFDRRSVDAATLVLGILSCMKSPPPPAAGGRGARHGDPPASSPDSNVAGNRSKRGGRVDFRSFPRAREGTLIRHVVEWIERCYHSEEDAAMMPPLLRCIGGGVVSLPGQFSRLFYSLLSDGASSTSTPSRDVRYECLRAISSQVEYSRGDDVRDFANVAVEMSRLSPPSLRSLLDDAGLQTAYLQSLRHGLSRFPSGYVERGIQNLWDGCCGILLNGRSVVAAETIMLVLSDVVKSSKGRRSMKAAVGKEKNTTRRAVADMLPPIAVTSIQTAIVTKIFPSLVAMVKAPGMQNVPMEEGGGVPEGFGVGFTDACKLWDAFLRCLDVVPLVQLEEADFFVFGEGCTELRTLSSTLCRAFGTMHLVTIGAFDSIPDRMQLEVAKVRTWLSRQRPIESAVGGVAEAQIHSMRLLAVEVARAGASLKSTVRRDAILRSFEIIQVTNGSSPMCLEQLAFDTSHWCQEISSTFVPGLRQARERSEVASSYSSLLVVRRGAAAFTGVPRITSAVAGELASLYLSDLPPNLGTVCRDLSMSETISRQALQQVAKSAGGESGADGRPRKNRARVDDTSFAQTVFYCYSEEAHGFEPLASLATSLTHEAALLR